jgi:hypothetical protein
VEGGGGCRGGRAAGGVTKINLNPRVTPEVEAGLKRRVLFVFMIL